MEPTFVKANSSNLPRIDVLMLGDFLATNKEFFSSEFRNVKTSLYNNEKDDDTDGISIISDSDHEPISAHDNNESEKQSSLIEDKGQYQESHVSIDEVIGDSSGKVKTYVHRRNKKLSTVLNILMLGSVITAAGVAIGHTWGARNDCTLQNSVSVEKILTNLYKVQAENAILRKKLRELAHSNIFEMPQNTVDPVKTRKNRCKKVFEETLNNRKTQKFLKCVDSSMPDINSQTKPEFEQDFLNDLNLLKRVYHQNRRWLDKDIESRLKEEFNKNYTKYNKTAPTKDIVSKYNLEESKNKYNKQETVKEVPEYQEVKIEIVPEKNSDPFNPLSGSLDSGQTTKKLKKINVGNFMGVEEQMHKKRNTKEIDIVSVGTSETEFKKVDTYKNKHKNDKKKHDRQKSFKKLKRRNKYEQWEMKGGYLRDYDDVSVPSLMDSEYNVKTTDQNFFARDYEKNLYPRQFSDLDLQKDYENKDLQTENNDKDTNWYESRASSRKQARKILEKQLFGDSTPNTSAWYFRRMYRREQCRVKGDNSTYKKNLKRFMNYKMKH